MRITWSCHLYCFQYLVSDISDEDSMAGKMSSVVCSILHRKVQIALPGYLEVPYENKWRIVDKDKCLFFKIN